MKPLDGCRVLDLGIITAGAATSAILADLGAEVIKVESPTYHDPFREWVGRKQAGDGALSPFFRATNRNKLGISLDLKHADGRQIFTRLVGKSDIVVENFRRGVLDKFGFAFPALQQINRDIILASISSQGETGPDALHVSYGSTLESVGGLAWITGYAGEGPRVTGVELNYPDQVVAIFAASMIVTAWLARTRGQGGVHLDLSQRELTSFLVGELFTAPDKGPLPSERTGNADPAYALQDCFAAADGAWVAVSVAPAMVGAAMALLAPVAPTALPEAMRHWMASQKSASAVAQLLQAGIPAAVARNGLDLWADRPWSHGIALGAGDMVMKGQPFRIGDAVPAIERDAPQIGADTVDVLARIAGYSRAEIDVFHRAGVIEIDGGTTAVGN